VGTNQDDILVLDKKQYNALIEGKEIPDSDVGITVEEDGFELSSTSGLIVLGRHELNCLA